MLLILSGTISINSFAQCIFNTAYTLNPPPVNGQYELGQTVQICGQFSYTQSGSTWAHGIVPVIPAGWDISSLEVQPPNSCSGNGVWGCYNSVTGTAGSAGTHGPGIFYDTGGDGNPGNNFGDNCAFGVFNFCITLTTVSDCDNGGLEGTNLNVNFLILGDNASGSWNSFSCNVNGDLLPVPPALSATLNCCGGEDLSAEFCEGSDPQNLFELFMESPAGGTWSAPGGGTFDGVFIPGTSPTGIYSYAFDDGDCDATSTIEVSTFPAPDAGIGSSESFCEGAPPFNLFDLIADGDDGGIWASPSGTEVPPLFTPGTSPPGVYTYTISAPGCPDSSTEVEVTITPNADAGENGSVVLCESNPPTSLFDFLQGTPEAGGSWTDPLGNVFSGEFNPASDSPGTYTYTVGSAPCDGSATVEVSVIDVPFAGNDATVEICSNAAPTDLFDELPGANLGGFWTSPSGNVTGSTFTPGVDETGPYTYTVGDASCNDEATVTVAELPIPEATVSTDDFCEGTELELTFTLSGQGPFDVTYTVNGEEFNLLNINNGHTVGLSPNGSVTIEIVQVTDANCTHSGNTISAQLIEAPSAEIEGGGELCPGQDGSISFVLPPNETFDVVYTDGSNNFTLNGITNGHTVTVSPGSNTTYTLISVSYSEAPFCEGTVSGSAVFTIVDGPEASISGSTTICQGESAALTFNLDGNGPFDVVYTDGTSNFNLNGIQSGHQENVTPDASTTYTLVSAVSSNNPDCDGAVSGEATITVAEPPTFGIPEFSCNSTNDAYTVSFTISGGEPGTYTVAGDGSITGNTFTSDEINSGESFSFLLDDANGCGPVVIEGDHECICETWAGTMQLNAISACGSEVANAFHNGDEVLDGNDALAFVLHDSPGEEIGNVFGQSTEPSFSYQANLNYGETYYISPVAGNQLPGGDVDLNDECLSVGAGTPVVFHPTPEATLSGGGEVCEGETTTLTVTLTGTAPWNVEWTLNGNPGGNWNVNESPFSIEVDEGGTYTLLNVEDTHCSGSVSGTAEVIVFPTPTATLSNGGVFCEGDNDGPQINFTGTGPWSYEYAVNGVSQGSFNTNSTTVTLNVSSSGTYSLIEVSDQNCTGEVSGVVEATLQPLPTATISGGGTICADETALIQFNGTGAGNISVSYQFSGDPPQNINLTNGESIIETSSEGTYTILSVSDDFCSQNIQGQSATLNVVPLPTAQISLQPPVICEGESMQLLISAGQTQAVDLVFSTGSEIVIEEGVTGFSQTIEPQDGETFTLISIAYSSEPSCIQEVNQSVIAEVLPAPTAPVLSDVFRCTSDSFPVIGTPSLPGLSYLWSPAAGLSDPTSSQPTLILDATGNEPFTQTFTLAVSNTACTVFSTMQATIDPGPPASFSYSPNPVTTDFTAVSFNPSASGDLTYLWSFDELGTSAQRRPTFVFPEGESGFYEVILEVTDNATGCINQQSQIIEVIGRLLVHVPNAFTPDGDGINELFGPVMLYYRPETFEFTIFSRNGQVVFHTTDPEQKWNGSDPGGNYYGINEVYVWTLRVGSIYSTEISEFKGTVTLIR